MTLQNRVKQLENKAKPAQDTPALMKPSEILQRAEDLIAAGTTPSQEQARRIDALRRMVKP